MRLPVDDVVVDVMQQAATVGAAPSSALLGSWLAGLREGTTAAVHGMEMIAAVTMAGRVTGDRTAGRNLPGIAWQVVLSGCRSQQQLPSGRSERGRCARQQIGVAQVRGRGERSRQIEQQPLSHSCWIVRSRLTERPASAVLIRCDSGGK